MIALLLPACGGGTHKLPTTTITVDGHAVLVEVADQEEERSQGLMNRDSMPADEGMIFVYPDERPRSVPSTIASLSRTTSPA